MNTYDDAIKNLCTTRRALNDEIVKLGREARKVEKALKALGVDPDTRRPSNGRVPTRKAAIDYPTVEESTRRREQLDAFLAAIQPGETFRSGEISTILGEGLKMKVIYRGLLAWQLRHGERSDVVQVSRGVYRKLGGEVE